MNEEIKCAKCNGTIEEGAMVEEGLCRDLSFYHPECHRNLKRNEMIRKNGWYVPAIHKRYADEVV